MLLLDRRIGSGDLVTPLRRLGLEVDVTTLDFADAAFLGNGPAGAGTMQIGIEIKKIHDLISSIDTGRLSGHQIPGLLRQYDAVWLIVEGLWRPASDGLLELHRRGKWEALSHGKRRYMYREIHGYLTTLELKCGVRIRRTANEDETVRVIADLYAWWTHKEWAQHRSHLAMHDTLDASLLVPPPLRHRIARQFEGLGGDKAMAVRKHFPTSRAMLAATEKEWAQVPGIGKILAKRIITDLDRE